jgi:hypothetical protein
MLRHTAPPFPNVKPCTSAQTHHTLSHARTVIPEDPRLAQAGCGPCHTYAHQTAHICTSAGPATHVAVQQPSQLQHLAHHKHSCAQTTDQLCTAQPLQRQGGTQTSPSAPRACSVLASSPTSCRRTHTRIHQTKPAAAPQLLPQPDISAAAAAGPGSLHRRCS